MPTAHSTIRQGRRWLVLVAAPAWVFERSGHYPFVEKPQHVTDVVAAFLSSVPG